MNQTFVTVDYNPIIVVYAYLSTDCIYTWYLSYHSRETILFYFCEYKFLKIIIHSCPQTYIYKRNLVSICMYV